MIDKRREKFSIRVIRLVAVTSLPTCGRKPLNGAR